VPGPAGDGCPIDRRSHPFGRFTAITGSSWLSAVLDHMPVKQVLAMLRASKPAAAANVLLALTADRVGVLMTELEPPDVARILLGAKPAQKAELLAWVPADARLPVLRQLSTPQLIGLLSELPPAPAARILTDLPPRVAAELFVELAADVRGRLGEPLAQTQPDEFWSVLYDRRAAETLVSVASRVSWLDERAAELQAEVFGQQVHVAVRYRARPGLTGPDLAEAAARVSWPEVAGLLVLTQLGLADSAKSEAEVIRRSGFPVEAIRWADDSDDGTLKRALVRLTS
jgi:MgtE intracellular N domain